MPLIIVSLKFLQNMQIQMSCKQLDIQAENQMRKRLEIMYIWQSSTWGWHFKQSDQMNSQRPYIELGPSPVCCQYLVVWERKKGESKIEQLMTQKHIVVRVVVVVIAIMVNPQNTYYMPNCSFKSLNLRTTLEGKHYYHHFQMKLKKRINHLKGHEREVF